MWNKIYLIILAAAVLVSGVLTYFSYSWLQSIGAPATVVDNYGYYSNIGSVFLWISTAALLIAGNIVLWKLRKPWALWTTFLYFAIFILLQTFWLEQTFFHFKQENNFSTAILSFSPFLGIMLLILMGIFVFFNQYLVKRLHDKMYLPEQQAVPELREEIPVDENRI